MAHTIRVITTRGPDLVGKRLLAEIKQHFGQEQIREIRTAKVYRLEGLSENEAKQLTEIAFCEPINQDYTINKPIHKTATIIEIAYKPGVMNPEVGSILKVAADLGIKPHAADTSREYAFYGTASRKDINKIVRKLNLYNEITEYIVTKEPNMLMANGALGNVTTVPLRSLSDDKLMQLSKDKLFLNLEEMKAIQAYFRKLGRDPTDCEIEVLAQTWSEHCVHKTFKAQLTIDKKKKKPLIDRLKATVKRGDKRIVSAFIDNSGVIDFYEGYAICGKVETHNSPSAIEPYGGAMTGSGGVFRDVLGTGQGARVLISTDIFCLAPPDLPKHQIPPGCLSPEYILKKVVQGVRDYGNRVGIPTSNGSLHFHPDFRAKPTVTVGAYGIIEKEKAKKGAVKPRDLIITLGGRTGRDGIHGATFSSGEMTHRTIRISGSAVQIGNAIEEKRIIDAVQELQKQNLIRAITDCGAGGYSSAIGEMGKKTGATVNLEKVPLKYTGLLPWEIFLSESQERMVIAIDSDNINRVLAICKLYNVEATVIGEFTNTKRLEVFYNKKIVCDLDMAFLHDGLPQRHMRGVSRKVSRNSPLSGVGVLASRSGSGVETRVDQLAYDLTTTWKKVLSHGNVCSKEPIVRMYDHTVQGSSALSPFGGVDFDAPNDAVIVKPFFDKPYGLIAAHGLNPVLNQVDPYWGSIWAITEAVSNYVAVGGNLRDAALIDNFIWPFPDEESLADLDKAVDACIDMAKILNMPFVSGKDSLSSTYRYRDGRVLKIPPVLLISVFGKIKNVSKTVSSDFKNIGSTIVFVGKQDTEGMGGSIYFSDSSNSIGTVPKVDVKKINSTLNAITEGIQAGLILSCHDVSEGGLAVALAEMCFGAGFGAKINLKNISQKKPDFIFFNETAGTFLVEVADEKTATTLFTHIPYAIIGRTKKAKRITISYDKTVVADATLWSLKTAWQKTMRSYF